MSRIYFSKPQNLNMNLQGNPYSYNNIFNASGFNSTQYINNNSNNNLFYNSILNKSNSSSYILSNNSNNNSNIDNNNNNTNLLERTQSINYIYQNDNINKNTWSKNGYLFYSPRRLDSFKNVMYSNYENLKYNYSYQNINYNPNSNINPNMLTNKIMTYKNNYNINSNNSVSTNAKSNISLTNIQKHISNPNIIISSNKKPKNEIKEKNEKNEKKIVTIKQLFTNLDPKPNFDPSEFKIIKNIGEGAYGKIYITQWTRNNKKYAMKKELIKTNEAVNKSRQKIKLMNDFIKKTKSQGVIKIYGNLIKKEKNEHDFYYYILMELADKDWEKEINDRKKCNTYYTEKELFIIMSQLINTLALLQKNHITHRDIKPQNILIKNGIFKLTDFGEARTLKKTGVIVSRIRGTELFMSPNLFFGMKRHLSQVAHNTYKSDVFSLGLCFLFASTLSFNSLYSIREVNDTKIVEKLLEKYISSRYSEKFKKIILDMLQIDENLRPDFVSLEKKYFLKK